MGSQSSTTTTGTCAALVTASAAPDCDEVDSRLESPRVDMELDQPIIAKGTRLAYWVIQEVGFQKKCPADQTDIVLQTLCSCVKDILQKHVILFNGMVNRIDVHHYHEFTCVANELFEANSNNEPSQLRITWGRIIALFAFAVRLSQEYGQNQSRVTDITGFLATYVTKHVIDFVTENGGWNGLVENFPGTAQNDDMPQLRKAILWSGLCVGLAATMYISSLLR